MALQDIRHKLDDTLNQVWALDAPVPKRKQATLASSIELLDDLVETLDTVETLDDLDADSILEAASSLNAIYTATASGIKNRKKLTNRLRSHLDDLEDTLWALNELSHQVELDCC